jgi:hypothetical protein
VPIEHPGPGMPITEDLKYVASRCLNNPGSHVAKLRVRRSRSGAEKVLISLDIPTVSGPPRLEYHAFEIPVRVSSPFLSSHTFSSSYYASNYREAPTATLPVTYLIVTIGQGPHKEVTAL